MQKKRQFLFNMLTNTTAIVNRSKLVNMCDGEGKAFPQVMKTWTGDGISGVHPYFDAWHNWDSTAV